MLLVFAVAVKCLIYLSVSVAQEAHRGWKLQGRGRRGSKSDNDDRYGWHQTAQVQTGKQPLLAQLFLKEKAYYSPTPENLDPIREEKKIVWLNRLNFD